MAKIFVACILLQCCRLILSEFTFGLGKDRHRNADEKQEYLLNSLDEFDITYPTEVDRRGQVTDHVTTLSSHRRRRRSANEDPGPIIYQVNYKGKTIKLVLKVNDKLFGSDFVVEWHRENGTIERKRPTDNCFLIGETEPFHTSVAISDCDGLSGIIDLGEDSLYIEPVLNTTLIIHRGWTGHGRPHLMYKKAALHRAEARSLEVDELAFKDFSRGLKVEEKTSAARTASVGTAYVEFINYVNRAVKIFYINGGKEMTFKVLLARQTTLVDTFTSHKWIVRDLDTGRQLYINKRRIFTPPSGSSVRRRSMAYITVPRGMRLPKAREPSKPNSHITFINKSPRFVKLYYIEEGETIFFLNLSPGEEMAVSTYTTHRWFAKDLDTEKTLHVNGRNEYTPGRSNAHKRIQVYVTVPSTLSFPEMKFPDMLKTDPKYIEVMATADSSILLYHGKDKTEKYILTLMNIVSRIFQHKSIGAPIYFVVVKLVLLEKDPKEIKITTQPMPSLKSVCHWGHKNRKGFDRLTKDYYDQTVFITRKDFGPSGYAPVYGMCYRVRSCTLNQEDGFTSAFIIAHETGHTLGMEHDGVNNNCTNDVIKGSIMAPLVRARFDRFYWSSCSRRELLSKLSTLWCLNDAPFRNKIPYLAKLPGQIYTIDQQCRHDFGSNSRFCSSIGRDPCVELWCSQVTYSSYNNHFCQTRRSAALEGTKCAPNKWCRLGKCVPVDGKSFSIPLPRPTAKPVHGGWSEWSGVSECSRSCGVGVRHRERKCNNPVPKNNGSPCEGADIEYELCNTNDCPGHLLTFEQSRDQQCKRLGPSVLPEGTGVWSAYDVFKADIACDFENDFCDWTNDPLDNTDWTRKKGRTPTSGTGPSADHTVGEDGHYVFFETSRPVSPGWRARLVSKHIGMRIACLKFWYHAFGENVHMGELQLVVRSGLEEKVVWSVNQNRGDRWVVKYASIFSKKPYQLIFQGIRGDGYLSDFALDDISLTSGTCGIGHQRLLAVNNEISLNPCRQFCKLKKDGLGANTVEVEVENGTRCYDRLSSFDVCIRGKCQEIGCDGALGSNKVLDTCGVCGGNNQSCLATKGSISILPKEDMQTLMECPVGATNILLEDTSPNFLVLAATREGKPVINGAEEQSSSSVYEIAGAKVMYKREGNKEAISSLGPIKDRLIVKVKMNKKPAQMVLRYQFFKPKNNGVSYFWSHYKWSHCSQTCGEGIQTRIFKCRKQSDNTEVTDVNCFSSHKPEPLTKSCNLTACERYEWQVADWSSCSAPCGGGNQSREVTCKGVIESQVVNSALCTTEKPEAKQLCNDEPCPGEWIIGNWSTCSRTCGKGFQSRLIICQDYRGNRSLNCPKDSKPPEMKVCRSEPCIEEGPSVFQNMSCSFEEGFCQWTNLKNSILDQFDWVLFNGSTPSRNTGPPHDHTLGTSEGVYAYIEASDPQQRNDRARLLSPMVYARKVCFNFWYHMYGASMGWLRVFVKSPNVRERRLWYRSGNQGNEWINERLQISSYLPYQIIIEGIRGKGFSSDAAVDDIKLTSGSCPAFDTPRSKCKGDKSRYCKAAIRFNWCSSEKWGRICCKTCQDTVGGQQ